MSRRIPIDDSFSAAPWRTTPHNIPVQAQLSSARQLPAAFRDLGVISVKGG